MIWVTTSPSTKSGDGPATEQKGVVKVEVKDSMDYEDFAREFNKFTGNGPFLSMGFEGKTALLLHQPYALYTFEPYDKVFPSTLSTGAKDARKIGHWPEKRSSRVRQIRGD